jgi:hypothetical protein
MKTKLISLLVGVCLGAASLVAADTKFGLAADNRIYAQQLVGQIIACRRAVTGSPSSPRR